MQKCTVVMLSLLAGLYGAQAMAAETVASDKKAATVKKHKKDCVEHEGKPCHLHAKKMAADAQGAEALKASEEGKAISGVAAAPLATTLMATVTVVAPQVVPVVPVVPAADTIALAKRSGCLACHSIAGVSGGGTFGPKWNEVAKHYRGDANAEAFLVNKIARGGSGVWGRNAMPANSPRVSDADIRTLAKFVLNLQ